MTDKEESTKELKATVTQMLVEGEMSAEEIRDAVEEEIEHWKGVARSILGKPERAPPVK